jgi:spermidine synthase
MTSTIRGCLVTSHIDRFSIPFAITALGISHVITQITVIREFMNVFAGNEIIAGVLISLWLLLTGFGAYAGRYIRSHPLQSLIFSVSLFVVAMLPIVHIVLIRFLKNHLFARGELPGLEALILWSAVLLLPYCIITGGLLTVACTIMPTKAGLRRSIGYVYFFDNIGDILGGVLFTFVLAHFFNNLDILYVPSLLCLCAYLLTLTRGIFASILRITAVAAILALFVVFPLDTLSLKWLYPHQEIALYDESPYGRLVVTKDRGQTSFFENGEHLFSTPNIRASEEMVHFALPQIERTDSILLVSGGIAGLIDEILKYDVRRIDYVEIDPRIIPAGLENLDIDFPERVHVHLEDGRKFIQETPGRYDAVILNLPDPVSLQLNRFYTVEFFREAKAVLRPGGVITFGLGGAENYISDDQARLLSTLHNSLRAIFRHTVIIPGERNIFIASDRPLTDDIAPLISSRGISTTYINEDYLTGWVTPERVSFLKEHLIDIIAPNHDFHPAAYLYTMRVWLSMFQEQYLLPMAVIFFFLMFYFFRLGMTEKVIFTTGFTAASMEVIILLVYQILHGSVYTGIGLVIAAFMAGLALGSYVANRIERAKRGTLLATEGAIIVYLLLFVAALFAGKNLLEPAALAFLTLLMGALTGAEFPIAGSVLFSSPRETGGSLYTADLLGGSLGAFAVGIVLVPRFGIYSACFFLIALKGLIACIFLGTMRTKRG